MHMHLTGSRASLHRTQRQPDSATLTSTLQNPLSIRMSDMSSQQMQRKARLAAREIRLATMELEHEAKTAAEKTEDSGEAPGVHGATPALEVMPVAEEQAAVGPAGITADEHTQVRVFRASLARPPVCAARALVSSSHTIPSVPHLAAA